MDIMGPVCQFLTLLGVSGSQQNRRTEKVIAKFGDFLRFDTFRENRENSVSRETRVKFTFSRNHGRRTLLFAECVTPVTISTRPVRFVTFGDPARSDLGSHKSLTRRSTSIVFPRGIVVANIFHHLPAAISRVCAKTDGSGHPCTRGSAGLKGGNSTLVALKPGRTWYHKPPHRPWQAPNRHPLSCHPMTASRVKFGPSRGPHGRFRTTARPRF